MKKIKFYGLISLLAIIGLSVVYSLIMSISIFSNDIRYINSNYSLALSYFITLVILIFLFVALLFKTNRYKNKFL